MKMRSGLLKYLPSAARDAIYSNGYFQTNARVWFSRSKNSMDYCQIVIYYVQSGQNSVVGSETRSGMDGGSLNPGGGKGFSLLHVRLDRPWGPPGLLYNGYGVFNGGKAARAWR